MNKWYFTFNCGWIKPWNNLPWSLKGDTYVHFIFVYLCIYSFVNDHHIVISNYKIRNTHRQRCMYDQVLLLGIWNYKNGYSFKYSALSVPKEGKSRKALRTHVIGLFFLYMINWSIRWHRCGNLLQKHGTRWHCCHVMKMLKLTYLTPNFN